MLTEGQDKIKETLSISDKISDILSEEADAGSQHVIDSWLAQNEQNKALFNKICSDSFRTLFSALTPEMIGSYRANRRTLEPRL